jgi:acyl dehydratase
VAMLECSAKFTAAVHAGDTLYPLLEITELTSQRTTGVIAMRATVHNQRNELVLEGLHRYLVRKRPAPGA